MPLAARAITLTAIAGPISGSFPASGERPLAIGRAAAADICLVNEGVSRKHATLVPRDGSWHVIDHQSTGGTFLNGVRLTPGRATVVNPSDLLKIGPCAFRITAEGERTGPMATLVDAPSSNHRVERGSIFGQQTSDRRLKLLSDGLARLSKSATESQLAKVAIEIALAGSGYRWGAILRPVVAGPGSVGGGQVEILASFPEPTVAELVSKTGPPSRHDATFSRSLVRQAAGGELALLSEDRMPEYGQSIADMRIHSALCAPVHLGEVVEAFLYLDSRGDAGTVSGEAAGYCDAVAKAYGLAAANLKRVELEHRQSKLQLDLDAAREAQQMIQPPTEGDLGFVSYAARCVPGQFVAGDMFNVIPLDSGSVAICLGDVAGHGVASALVMAALQAHLHAQIVATGDPQAAVASLNVYLSARAASGRFASLWVGVISPEGRLRYVDAGHGHWLLQSADGARHRPAGGGGAPVGIDAEIAYSVGEVRMDPGQRLLLYSDGIVEQRGPDGQQFGLTRLHEALGAITPRAQLASVVAQVFAAVTSHAGVPGGGGFDDDTSAAVVEFRGNATA